MLMRTLGVTVAALLISSTNSQAAGDVAQGKIIAIRCASCHSFEPGKIKIGPSLFGVVGRTAGTVPNFNYSTPMRRSGIVWTPANLDAYLGGPKTVVLGNHMGYAGVTGADERANLIAYLATLR